MRPRSLTFQDRQANEAYLPSREQIAAECAAIQAEWDDAEEQRHAGSGRRKPANILRGRVDEFQIMKTRSVPA